MASNNSGRYWSMGRIMMREILKKNFQNFSSLSFPPPYTYYSRMWIGIGQGGVQYLNEGLSFLAGQEKEMLQLQKNKVLFIDSEAKTTSALQQSNKCAVLAKSGCGNCWSMGYSMSSKELDSIIEVLRRQIELYPPRFLAICNSLGGGNHLLFNLCLVIIEC